MFFCGVRYREEDYMVPDVKEVGRAVGACWPEDTALTACPGDAGGAAASGAAAAS